jgi:hypothetical protein
MKKTVWLNVGLALTAAVLAAFLYYKTGASAAHRLASIPASAIERIRLDLSGHPQIVIERRNRDWMITAPIGARADASRVQALLAVLDASASERYAAEGLARFGLQEPHARLTVNDQAFSFGAVNELTREQYVLAANAVYLVPLRYGAALPRQVLQLASRQLFAPGEAPDVIRLAGFEVAQRGDKCEFSTSGAGEEDCKRWLDEWRLATAADVVPASGSAPLATIEVVAKGNAFKLAVIEREPDFIVARLDQNLAYRFPAALGKRLLSAPGAGKD